MLESQIKLRTETIALSSFIHLPIQCRTILLIVPIFSLTNIHLLSVLRTVLGPQTTVTKETAIVSAFLS